MITKDQLAASMARECEIISHLFTKLPPGCDAYSPGPGQRTTIELLRYISYCASAGIRSLVARDWREYGVAEAESARMSMNDFPAAMALQKSEILAFFAKVTADELMTSETKLPGGAVVTLGLGVVNGPLKWLVAYKMQLFLYAKANGAKGIGTSNLWGGVDRPPPT